MFAMENQAGEPILYFTKDELKDFGVVESMVEGKKAIVIKRQKEFAEQLISLKGLLKAPLNNYSFIKMSEFERQGVIDDIKHQADSIKDVGDEYDCDDEDDDDYEETDQLDQEDEIDDIEGFYEYEELVESEIENIAIYKFAPASEQVELKKFEEREEQESSFAAFDDVFLYNSLEELQSALAFVQPFEENQAQVYLLDRKFYVIIRVKSAKLERKLSYFEAEILSGETAIKPSYVKEHGDYIGQGQVILNI